jgi:hypothetical protein
MCNVVSGHVAFMAVSVGNRKATSVYIYIYIYIFIYVYVNKNKAITVQACYRP